MSRFQFVADHRDTFEVKWLCAVVEIARSSFYAWLAAADSRAARAAADEELAGRIRVGARPRTTPTVRRGSPLSSTTVSPEAERVNHKRVARVMRAAGIAGYRRKRRVKTTVPIRPIRRSLTCSGRDFTAAAAEHDLRRGHHLPAAGHRREPVSGHGDRLLLTAGRGVGDR